MLESYGTFVLLAIVTPFTLAILAIFSIYSAFFGGFGITVVPGSDTTKKKNNLLFYRFLAWVFDLGLFTLVFVILYPLIIFDISLLSSFSPLFPLLSSWMIALLYFIGPFCFMLVSAYLEHKTGQTLGKYIFYLKVVNQNGDRPSFRQTLIRNFGRAFFTIIDALGYLTASHGQRFTEKLAKTKVVSIW